MTNTMTVRIYDNAAERKAWGTPAYRGRIVRALTIAATCPICGGPRGEPRSQREVHDDDWYTVDVWSNPCQHVDYYDAVVREAAR